MTSLKNKCNAMVPAGGGLWKNLTLCKRLPSEASEPSPRFRAENKISLGAHGMGGGLEGIKNDRGTR